MRHLLLTALSVVTLSASIQTVQAGERMETPVDYVNPLVGSASSYELSTGNTYPAIAMPWGMNFWTPQTGKMGDGWVYTYDAHKIRGLKQTHQPSPWINDYGQFALMATVGKPVFDETSRASWFSHKGETVTPYYYRVYLADYDITAELAPTERACIFRFTMPSTDSANIVIDAYDKGSAISVDAARQTVTGYSVRNSGGVPQNFRDYFVITFDKPFKVTYENHGDHSGAIVTFSCRRGEQVTARVASSFISEQQAWQNLKEVGEKSFEAVKAAGKQRWNDVLGHIEASDDNVDHLRTFYSCLYRSTLFPRKFYEVTAAGDTVHYSPYNGQVLPGTMFTDTGFWDTFRSLFPLVNLVYPSMASQMQQGLVNAYKESGFLPEWASPGHRDCMVGNNSASIVADAWIKGIRGYDVETLWQAVCHDAHSNHPTVGSTGRKGWQWYDKLGYVPCDVGINESAARTLEYAYDDWCIYQLGKALGKKNKETEPYYKRSFNYRNLFSTEYNLMRGRKKDGSWETPFNPFKWGDVFTEGNAWHYTWSVFQRPDDLIKLMGGEDKFNAMMDSVFNLPPIFDDSYYGQVIHEIREMQVMDMGNYAHGNQPIQHMIYLYDWSHQPHKAQYWVREVMNRLYSATPDGYCGDEDNGQTSAWYVFSAMGFYPVCPGSTDYAIGTPYFRQVKLHLENGKTTVINCSDALKRYIQQKTVNGQPLQTNFLTHAMLTSGSKIDFEME